MTEAEKDAWIALLRSDVEKYREVFNALYSGHSSLNSAKFAEAVKLDKDLKEYGNED